MFYTYNTNRTRSGNRNAYAGYISDLITVNVRPYATASKQDAETVIQLWNA